MMNSSGMFPHFLGLLSRAPMGGENSSDPSKPAPHPFRPSAPVLKRSERTAHDWNAPGGGYDNWKKDDPARERAFPPGTRVNNPHLPPVPGAKPAPSPRRKLFQ